MPLFESAKLNFRLPGDTKDQNITLLKDLLPTSQAQIKVNRDLIVDDNDINRLILGKYLKRLGVEYDTACNGYEAVKLALLYEYDIIWMDIKMSVCNGLTATYFLTHMCQYKGKIYGTTGYADGNKL